MNPIQLNLFLACVLQEDEILTHLEVSVVERQVYLEYRDANGEECEQTLEF